MPNQEHLQTLTRGNYHWGIWRARNPDVVPDLEEADLQRVGLGGADLTHAKLKERESAWSIPARDELQWSAVAERLSRPR